MDRRAALQLFAAGGATAARTAFRIRSIALLGAIAITLIACQAPAVRPAPARAPTVPTSTVKPFALNTIPFPRNVVVIGGHVTLPQKLNCTASDASLSDLTALLDREYQARLALGAEESAA